MTQIDEFEEGVRGHGAEAEAEFDGRDEFEDLPLEEEAVVLLLLVVVIIRHVHSVWLIQPPCAFVLSL